MGIGPMFSALSRHKIAASLIVLEVALTCAILCNAIFLIGARLKHVREPSGVAESELVRIQLTGVGIDTDPVARTKEDLAALRAVPGVRDAAATNQLPLGGSSWNTGVRLSIDQDRDTLNTTEYFGTPGLAATLGVRVIRGRDLRPDEYLDFHALQKGGEDGPQVGSVLITRAMADRLFPGEDALGKTLYMFGKAGAQVVGIIETLVRPNQFFGPQVAGYSVIAPVNISYDIGGNYLIRVTDPSRRAQVLKDAAAALERVDRNRIILNSDTFEEIRANYYRNDRSMVWLLVVVCVALLMVTAFGIVGLASFWVAQRTRQIGIRRALGGTRRQILAYFQTENFVLSSFGILIGMTLAYGINQWLMSRYELPRLPLMYLPMGALLLWILGQLAVLGPAMRAAAVPPAVATRSA